MRGEGRDVVFMWGRGQGYRCHCKYKAHMPGSGQGGGVHAGEGENSVHVKRIGQM